VGEILHRSLIIRLGCSCKFRKGDTALLHYGKVFFAIRSTRNLKSVETLYAQHL